MPTFTYTTFDLDAWSITRLPLLRALQVFFTFYITCENVVAWLAILRCKTFIIFILWKKSCRIRVTNKVNKCHFLVITAIFIITLLDVQITLLKLMRCPKLTWLGLGAWHSAWYTTHISLMIRVAICTPFSKCH